MMRLLMSAAFICIMGTGGYWLGMSWGEGGVIAWAQLFGLAGVFMALMILMVARTNVT